MAEDRSGEITVLLQKLEDSGDGAREELVSFVYSELRKIASGLVKGESPDHTLRATDVVHEAYFRLFNKEELAWENRRHFFASAAIAMRRVLIDHARRKKAGKRIPRDEQIPIELMMDDGSGGPEEQNNDGATAVDILALDQALNNLAKVGERQAKIVELRYFGGLTTEEIAELFEISTSVVHREWRFARLWLRREMRRQSPATPSTTAPSPKPN
ncbi:MAG: sigma-70 family RNA polymerase sigma factor [Acidobacteriota bacterium]